MGKQEAEKAHKAHCLILPFPIQGHINPMLQFSKRLSHKGIKVTFAATKYLLTTTQSFPDSVSLETYSDGFDQGRGSTPLIPYITKYQETGTQTLIQLLGKLQSSNCPVDCLIYDPFLPWSLDVAKKFNLLVAAFFTQTTAVNNVYYHHYKGWLKFPVPDKDRIVVPGLPELKSSDLPSFLIDQESHPGALELLESQFQNIDGADFVLVNSVYELEKEVTDSLSKFIPIKTIGPTIPSMYLDKTLLQDKEYELSLFEPVNTCMEWLKHRTNRSVIYASFGSMAELQTNQMIELAEALRMGKYPFLWVVRSSEESKLPEGFSLETSEKGLIVSWCPQLEVLAHEAIGCFITHCGWNSTLEASCFGVPIIAMPWWSDQFMNAKFVEDVWKIGIRARVDSKVNVVMREEIVRCLECVMEGNRGVEMRDNARRLGDFVRGAMKEGGSSQANIDEFVSKLV